MGKNEGPVKLIFRKGTRVNVGGRGGPDVDAVDLDSSNRMPRSSTLAAAHQDRQS